MRPFTVESRQRSTKVIQSSISTQQLEGQGTLASSNKDSEGSSTYLAVDFTRHLFSCLKGLEIGIPDTQEV